MDRTQKKCIIASTGAHLLLALILIIGPAFGSSKAKQDDLPLLDFVPFKTVDGLISGGGYRDGNLPKAAPVIEQPPPKPSPTAPAVEKQPDPAPKESPTVKAQPKEDPDSLVPTTQSKHKPEISTAIVTRKRDSSDAKKADAKAKEAAKEWADSRRQLAESIGRAADRIGDEVAGTTSIRFKGPGGGGLPYANFLQAVKTVYENSWVVPDGVSDDYSTVVASVTIARDGSVVRSEIIRRSGNALVDHSVQATLNRVKFACPLPDDAKESERTVTIDFNVKVKQGLG